MNTYISLYYLALALIIILNFNECNCNNLVAVEDNISNDSAHESSQVNSPFEALIGSKLYAWSKENPEQALEYSTSELLKDKKVVALYFSASWCGPCRQFTPQLEKFYLDVNKKGKKFEIIFVSRDRSQDEFAAYFSKMPWLAVPLQNVQEIIQFLAPKFNLKGIPHLVILDGEDASLITTDGRTNVLKDSYGLEFPWRSRSILNLLPKPFKKLINNKIEEFKQIALKTLQGVLQSLAPSKLLSYIKSKLLLVLQNGKKIQEDRKIVAENYDEEVSL